MDNVSESHGHPGGRLWSRSLPPIPGAQGNPEITSGRRYLDSSKAQNSLLVLNDIEGEIQSLSSVLARISTIGAPPRQSSPFPLGADLASAYSVHDRLIGITNKSSTVQELKASLRDRLDSLIVALKEAQKIWIKAAEAIPPENQDSDETTYATEHHYTGILNGVDPIIQVSIFAMVTLQIILHTSRRGCRFILSMFRYVVQLGLMRATNILDPKHQKLLADFPRDSETAASKFYLRPIILEELSWSRLSSVLYASGIRWWR
ncbi:hypothetical protein BJ912DRAFT_1051908 [Pholiota molesta]|nr:hypothetical protein BJ912DRAFT_1051908 [Pholiota molesta]